MRRMKTKFQRLLLNLLLLHLRLSNSVTIGDEVVHIKFHLPPNAVPFGPPRVIHHTHTQSDNHNRRRHPSSESPVSKQLPQYHGHIEKPKNDVDSDGEIDDPKTEESVNSFRAVESMLPKIHYHDEPHDEGYNYRAPSDDYHSLFKDPESIYYSPNKQRARPIKNLEPDDSDYEPEHSHRGHQSPPRYVERDFAVRESYMSDRRYPYSYKTRNSALRVVDPKISNHYSKRYGSVYSNRPYRKAKNPFKSTSHIPVHHNHKYSIEDNNSNEPLSAESLYDESYSYHPKKSHYKTMSDEYYNHEPVDMRSGYHRYHSREPPKHVKFTAKDSFLPTSRYRKTPNRSTYKPSEPNMSMESYRTKHTRGPGLQGYEYSSSYPWL